MSANLVNCNGEIFDKNEKQSITYLALLNLNNEPVFIKSTFKGIIFCI
jgi:hypothetical protein